MSSSTFTWYKAMITLAIFSSCMFSPILITFVLYVTATWVVKRNLMSTKSSAVSIPYFFSRFSIGGSRFFFNGSDACSDPSFAPAFVRLDTMVGFFSWLSASSASYPFDTFLSLPFPLPLPFLAAPYFFSFSSSILSCSICKSSWPDFLKLWSIFSNIGSI